MLVNYPVLHEKILKFKTVIDPEDNATYQKYLALWKEGRFLAESKSFMDDFSKSRNKNQRLRFEPLLKSNTQRMKVLLDSFLPYFLSSCSL